MMEVTTSNNLSIGQQLAALSPAKRSLLELRLMKKNGRRGAIRPVIQRHPKRESAPLSYNQQGLWVLNQLMPGTSLYHTPTAARLKGTLDVAALKKALDFIVARHDALRTTFTTLDGTPTQVIAKNLALEMPLIDLSQLPESERESEALRLLRQEARRPFDLSQGPLIRAILLRLHERE